MYSQDDSPNPLRINYMLHELAVEYGIKDYKMWSYTIDGIYHVTMSWYHTIKEATAHLCIAVTEKALYTKPYMDDYSYCQKTLWLKLQKCERGIVAVIAECGSVQ